MISTSENQVIYLGDGVKREWDLTFKILQKEDLHLIRVAADGTEQEITSDYYVHMDTHIVDYPGYAPGAEIPEAAQPLKLQRGEKLVLYRDVEIVQETDMPDQWPFDVIENALDKACIIDQQLQGQIDRTLKINRSAWTSGFDGTIPIAPGKSLRFSEDGTKFEATEDPTVATVAAEAAANAAAASAASAATSAANVSSFYPRIEAINENVTRIGESASYNAEQTAINKNLSEQFRNQANSFATTAEGYSTAAGVSAAEAKASENELAGVKEKLDELVNVANDGTWQYDENLNIEPITRPFNNKYWKLNADGTLSPIDIATELTERLTEKIEDKVSWGVVNDNALDVPPVLQHSTVPNAFAVNQKLAGKQDKLTAGENITIANNVISAQGKNYDSDIEEINSNVSQQFAEIVTLQTELAEQKKVNADQQRQINFLHDMTEGVAWRKEIDTEEAYSKVIPKGTKGLSLNSIGGKCIVENQLVDEEKISVVARNGITCQRNGNTFVYNGTATANADFDFIPRNNTVFKENLAGHKLYFNITVQNGDGINYRLYFQNQVSPYDSVFMVSGKPIKAIYTLPNLSTEYLLEGFLRFYANETVQNFTVTYQTVDLTTEWGAGNEPDLDFCKQYYDHYRPYTEPTIKTIACESIEVQGRNLIPFPYADGKTLTRKGITFTQMDDGSLVANGTATANAIYYFTDLNKMGLQNDTVYTLQGELPSNTPSGVELRVSDSVTKAHSVTPTRKSTNFSYADTSKCYVTLQIVAGTTVNNLVLSKPQVVKGSEALEYAPYTTQSLPLPPAIQQLDCYGAGVNGVSNRVYWEDDRCLYEQKTIKIDLSSLVWAVHDSANNVFRSYSLNNNSADANKRIKPATNGSTKANMLVASYSTETSNNYVNIDKSIACGTTGTIYIRNTSFSNANDLRQSLQGEYLYYELQNPVVDDITDKLGDFENNTECESNGTITFKNTLGDDYRIPIPNEEEYIVKVSEAL